MPDETTMEEEENPLETSRSNDVSLRESRLKDSMQEIQKRPTMPYRDTSN